MSFPAKTGKQKINPFYPFAMVSKCFFPFQMVVRLVGVEVLERCALKEATKRRPECSAFDTPSPIVAKENREPIAAEQPQRTGTCMLG